MTENKNNFAAALKPCPFCGGEGQSFPVDTNGEYHGVKCKRCRAEVRCLPKGDWSFPGDDPYYAWNTRTTPPEPTAGAERAIRCGKCGDTGLYTEVRPVCCGKNEDGSCHGDCPVPEEYQEQCDECPAALSQPEAQAGDVFLPPKKEVPAAYMPRDSYIEGWNAAIDASGHLRTKAEPIITEGGVSDTVSIEDATKYWHRYIDNEMRDPNGLNSEAKAALALIKEREQMAAAMRDLASVCEMALGMMVQFKGASADDPAKFALEKHAVIIEKCRKEKT